MALTAVLLASVGTPASPGSQRLPDLAMARLRNLDIEAAPDGRRLLRFDSIIVNVGGGRFEVLGKRVSAEQTTMDTVVQRLYDGSGQRTERAVAPPLTRLR